MAQNNTRKSRGKGGTRMFQCCTLTPLGLMLVLKSCSLPFLRIVRLRLYDHSERSHETFTNPPTGWSGVEYGL